MRRRFLAYILMMLSLASCMNALDAPSGNDLLAPALTISTPVWEEQPMNVSFSARLNGGMKSDYKCGFYISQNKDFSNAEKVKASNVDTKTGSFSYVRTFPGYDATCYVKAYCSNGRIELTSTMVSYTHKRIAVTGVSLSSTSRTLTVGDTYSLTATVNPSNADNKNVTWSSNNTGVATVDQTGKVTAVKEGTATITVKTQDGGYTATCYVTVNSVRVTGVSLSSTSRTLTVGSTYSLTATVNPSNAGNKSVTWSSNNTGVATVDQTGKVTAVKEGTATITVKTADGGYTATCTVTVQAAPTGYENGYGYVDLGLSVKWATCNVGATSPEGYGDYFAWGETVGDPYVTGKTSGYTKSFNWSTYKYCMDSYTTMTKYCDNSSYGYNGFTDNRTTLELSDDAARANWGGSWRMPTIDEFIELSINCTWTWTTRNGVNGYKVVSKKSGYEGRFIFLPAAGYRIGTSQYDTGSDGNYLSSSLNTGRPYDALGLYFNSGKYNYYYSHERYYGFSVRPVCQ